jgi:DNA polymerase elongation subunit (family B)
VSIPDSVSEAIEKSKIVAKAVNAIMAKPKRIEFEKVYSTMLLLSKKRYGGLKFTENHVWGEEPPLDVKGVQSVRRDGTSLVRDLVGECLASILQSGDILDAAGTVRRRLLDVVDDKLPVSVYAISKTLRKTVQDCSQPMTKQELREIRHELGSSDTENEEQLSYNEIDQCIYQKVKLVWRTRVKLLHVNLAWTLRLLDPGSAPVLGETIRYIVTQNGNKQIADKVESLERFEKNPALVCDRAYYLKCLEVPMDNLFYPPVLQALLLGQNKKKATKDDEARAHKTAKEMLWDCVRGKPLTQSKAKRAASIAASPLALAFKKQKPS